jgi:hypothetical protein
MIFQWGMFGDSILPTAQRRMVMTVKKMGPPLQHGGLSLAPAGEDTENDDATKLLAHEARRGNRRYGVCRILSP